MTPDIKLLQIAKHFFPDTGGIETVTQSISDVLVGHGIRADVLCTGTGRDYPPSDTPYQVIRCAPGLRFGRNKSLSPAYVRKVVELDARYDCAIVHMPNPVAAAAVLAGWSKPVILLWHADIPQPAIRALGAPLDALLASKAAAVIGPTPVHLLRSHRSRWIAPKGVVIGYPFDRTRLPEPTGTSATMQRVAAFARGRKISLSIGRLVPYKGFDVLIEASSRFGDEIAAVIVGGGPLQGELAARIEAAGASDRVMLTGPIDDPALADLLDAAHMGCMPSVTAAEMYGVAQVEAFAFGKPVVSTRLDRSGVPYVNRHDETGLTVEPGDPDALAAAMLRLAGDEALHSRLAAGAARSFAQDHDIAAIGRVYAGLIRDVVAGRAPDPQLRLAPEALSR